MPVWLAVALGGAAGSVARWQAGNFMRALWPGFPYGTLLVNVLGSFLIGFLAAWFAAREPAEWLRVGLIAGILGGFTTFSAFSLDTLELWRTSGLMALANISLNLGLGLLACMAGLYTARLFLPAS